MPNDNPRFSLNLWLTTGVLVAVAALLAFYHLGVTDFFQNAPAQLATDVRQMNQQGTWLVPLGADGQPNLESAPLYLWAAKLTSLLRADVHPFNTRLPAAICSILLILFTAFWFFQHVNRYSRDDSADPPIEGFTLLAGLIVATSPVLYSVGREGTPASMFALVYLLAAYCWAESLEARRSFYAGFSPRFWLLWGYALAGLAMLVQGPIPLLLLWIPYICAARAYHLRGFSPAHLLGVILAFALGAGWPLAVALHFPAAAHQVWSDWIQLKAFNSLFADDQVFNFFAAPDASPLIFLRKLFLSTFPWCLIALAMVGRVWRRKDRSPTLVYWTWTFVANTFVLAFLDHHAGSRLLLVPFVGLLAVDGLYRWDFENVWAAAWRVVLRVSVCLSIAIGLFLAILLSEPIWIVVFGLIPLAWAGWVLYTRRSDLIYTRWQTTVRLAGMMLLIVTASLAMLLAESEPRLNFHRDAVAYFARVREQLSRNTGAVYYLGDHLPGLYAFYGARLADSATSTSTHLTPPVLVKSLEAIAPGQPQPPIVFASHGIGNLLNRPGVIALADNRNDQGGIKEAMLQLNSAATLTTTTVHLALLGNTGTRRQDVLAVGRRLDKEASATGLHDAFLLGNNVYGPNLFNHLDFFTTFERPFQRALKRGVVFHALIGHEDAKYAFFQSRYAPFHMTQSDLYSVRPAGNLVELFMLGEQVADPLPRLEKQLRESKAVWKIIALNPALATGAADAQVDGKLAKEILPLAKATGVQLVAWAGGRYYERLKQPGAAEPLLLNTGWSGGPSKTTFKPGLNGHQAGWVAGEGLVLLDVTSTTLTWRARTAGNRTIDEGQLDRTANILTTGPMKIAQQTPTGTLLDAVETTPTQPAAGKPSR